MSAQKLQVIITDNGTNSNDLVGNTMLSTWDIVTVSIYFILVLSTGIYVSIDVYFSLPPLLITHAVQTYEQCRSPLNLGTRTFTR